MVENMFHHLLFLIIIISTTESSQECDPGIMKEKYTFKYNFIHKADELEWKKDGVKIVSCVLPNCSIMKLSDENTYNATISSNVSTLTINEVTTQSIGNYISCYNDSEVSECFNCTLRVNDPVNPDSGPNVGGIVGGTVAAFVVIICVIVVLVKKKINHHPESGVTEVEVDNTDLYNLNHPTPAIAERDSRYRISSEIIPNITAAFSGAQHMGNKNTSNHYEYVNSGAKSKAKSPTTKKPTLPTPQKPKPVAKPKSQAGKEEGTQAKNTAPDQTYARVVKLPKSDKPLAMKGENDEFFLDPTLQPEIPETNFECSDEDTNNEKIEDKG